MHPHINDEILTYLRSGYVEHTDSEGYSANISNTKLMLMKAGRSFFHEEKIIDQGKPLEGLQIFIRPGKKDLDPVVTFLELENIYSEDHWRLIASPASKTTLQFTSQTWIYDRMVINQEQFKLPELAKGNLTCLLYVFNGQVRINNEIHLIKKDSLIIKDELVTITATDKSELVLFITDEAAEHFDQGMYSGNQK
jgi:redox-sensitive bicupin YhaK (pirin superfamily)